MNIPFNCVVIAPPTAGKTTLIKTINEGLDVDQRIAGDLDYTTRHDVPHDIEVLHSSLLNAYFKMGMKLFVVSRRIDINALNPENLTVYQVEFTEARWQQLAEIAKERGDSNQAIERMTEVHQSGLYPKFDELVKLYGKRVKLELITLDRDQFLTDYFKELFGNDDDTPNNESTAAESPTLNEEPMETGTLNDEEPTVSEKPAEAGVTTRPGD